MGPWNFWQMVETIAIFIVIIADIVALCCYNTKRDKKERNEQEKGDD